MVVTLLVEQFLPIPEVRGLNPVIGNIYICHIQHMFTINYVEKKKKIKKEARNGPYLKIIAQFFKKLPKN